MKNRVTRSIMPAMIVVLASAALPRLMGAEAATVAVNGGTASFDATTNVSAVSIHGKSNALEARVQVRRAAEGLVLEQIEATVPVKTLGTGMGLRDEHMRKHVFTTPDGQVPDLHFTAEKAVCPGNAGGETTCQVSGNLSIRGVARPFTMALKIREANGSTFRAAGDGIVKLSAYGIPQPSQFGVKTTDEVKLHLEFTGKQTTTVSANAGGRR